MRDYNCETETGRPKVSFRESLREPVKYASCWLVPVVRLCCPTFVPRPRPLQVVTPLRSTAPHRCGRFDFVHKKQTGGSGQYGRVIGTLEPLTGEDADKVLFEDQTVGQNLPKGYIPSIEKVRAAMRCAVFCAVWKGWSMERGSGASLLQFVTHGPGAAVLLHRTDGWDVGHSASSPLATRPMTPTGLQGGMRKGAPDWPPHPGRQVCTAGRHGPLRGLQRNGVSHRRQERDSSG